MLPSLVMSHHLLWHLFPGMIDELIEHVEHILCTCTKCEHGRKQYFLNSPLSHMLLHSPKCNKRNYLTDIDLLNKLIFLTDYAESAV